MENPLIRFRAASGLSKADLGRALGYTKANPSRFYERFETGELPADADLVERISKLTAGIVSAADMHAVRLSWLKRHRPEKFEHVVREAAE